MNSQQYRNHAPLITILVCTLFFFSGFSSLTLQVAWNKILGQTIGIDYYSNIIIVSIFMLGLGIGGELGGYITRRYKESLYFFAAAEILIAIFALFSDTILRFIQQISVVLSGGDYLARGLAADFFCYFIVLIVPVILMGTSLPIVVHAIRDKYTAGTAVGRLYAVNIFGAAVGCSLSGLILTGILGLAGTIAVAVSVNIVLAVAIFAVLRKTADSITEKAPNIMSGSRPCGYLLCYSFLVGFLAIAYEILYFRVFVYYLGALSYVFPIVLTAYLLLLGAGTAFAGDWFRKGKDETELLVKALQGAILLSAIIFIFPYFYEAIGRSIPSTTGITAGSPKISFVNAVVLALSSLLPVACIAILFPLIIHRMTDKTEMLGTNVGTLYLVQTLGNFVGGMFTGIVLLPLLGTINTARVLIVLLLVLAVPPFINKALNLDVLKTRKLSDWAVTFVFISFIAILPINDSFYAHFKFWNISPTRVVEQHEGTALIYQVEGATRINIGAEAATSYPTVNRAIVWPMDVAVTALGRAPERVLIIGIGTGDQAVTLNKLYPQAEIVIVELLDVVITEMRERGSEDIKNLLAKSQIHIVDGSRYVNKVKVANEKPFDLVQVGVFHVTSSGAGNLFTREFIATLKSILSPDGVITFNAYVPAVKACEELFSTILIASRGPEKNADVILTNRAGINEGNFIDQYLQTRRTVLRKAEQSSLRTNFYVEAPADGFFIYKRETIKNILADFKPQTNDLLVTEHFLTNRSYFEYKDPRVYPARFADITVNEVAKREPSLFPVTKR